MEFVSSTKDIYLENHLVRVHGSFDVLHVLEAGELGHELGSSSDERTSRWKLQQM